MSYKLDTEFIGDSGEFGLKISPDSTTLPDKILGSASDLSLIINGVRLGIARGDALLTNADANSIIHLDEEDVIEPLNFAIRAPTDANSVRSWELNIWRDGGDNVKRLTRWRAA